MKVELTLEGYGNNYDLIINNTDDPENIILEVNDVVTVISIAQLKFALRILSCK